MQTKRPRTPAQLASDEKLRSLRKKPAPAAPPPAAAPEEPKAAPAPAPVAVRAVPKRRPRAESEVSITFISASGKLAEAYTALVPADVLAGAREVLIGPFPEAARNWPEEWQDFEEIAITVDGERRTYPVTGPYTR